MLHPYLGNAPPDPTVLLTNPHVSTNMTSEQALQAITERYPSLSPSDWDQLENSQIRGYFYNAGVPIPTTASFMNEVIDLMAGERAEAGIVLFDDDERPADTAARYLYEVTLEVTLSRRVWLGSRETLNQTTIHQYIKDADLIVDDWNADASDVEISFHPLRKVEQKPS